MRSLVMSSPWSSAITTPRCSTITREQSRSSSALSDEHTTVAVPCVDARSMRRWMSAFDPTSTPCVGSSSTSTRGVQRNQRAITTFCWLPPDSSPMIASVRAAGARRAPSIQTLACAVSARLRSRPPDQNGVRSPIVRFSRTVSIRNRASLARSAGTAHSPASIASRGSNGGISRPSTYDLADAQRRPDSRLASSSRPDPVSPAMPTTSPALHVEVERGQLGAADAAHRQHRLRSSAGGASSGCGRRPRRRARARASGWRGPRG